MPQSTFNDIEALKVAIGIERRGERFYTLAADKIKEKDEDAANMLKQLGREEKEHAKTFQKIYDSTFELKDDFDDTYLFEPEVAAYFDSMVKNLIFPSDEEQDKVLDTIEDVEDVLKFGIQAEKDSILFYTEMIIYSKYVEAKNAFREILKEEKKHLQDLTERLEEYRG
ncbi:MAG TPA: ferritin family protein [Clostridiales bacterium]|nr:ferritin family protein [Clostridiales bacterium]